MTDRELLELAAKAAGYKTTDIFCGYFFVQRPDDDVLEDWNPLTDDGDALRLAVKLRIFLDEYLRDRFAYLFGAEMVDHAPDKATRRAIVRAAARIGEGME